MKKQDQPELSISLLARTIHGVEWVAAAEIEKHLGASVTELRHREVRFRVAALGGELLELGSVDDLFLTCRIVRALDHTRASLRLLSVRASQLDFQRLLRSLRQLREVPKRPRFDVVASFLGRRNYNRFEIEDSLGEAFARQTGWPYLSRSHGAKPRSDITFRVHMSGEEAFIGLRLAATTLHRRPYKVATQPGSLHPPLAYAMAMLAGLAGGSTMLDPCCGVGTIPLEAARLQPAATCLGADLDAEALRKAVINARSAPHHVRFILMDAGRAALADGSIDRLISNPPWGRTVGARGALAVHADSLGSEMARLLRPRGRAVLLADAVEEESPRLESAGLRLISQFPVSLFGSWPRVCVLERAGTPETELFDARAEFGEELAKYWSRRPAEPADEGAGHETRV